MSARPRSKAYSAASSGRRARNDESVDSCRGTFERPDRRERRTASQRGDVTDFELVGHRIVGAHDRVGAMPGLAKRHRPAVRRRAPRAPPGASPAARLGARPNETSGWRNCIAHLVELEHPGRHRAVERVDAQCVAGEHRPGGDDLGQVLALRDGRDENHVARGGRKFTEAARERTLEPRGQRPRRVARSARNRKFDRARAGCRARRARPPRARRGRDQGRCARGGRGGGVGEGGEVELGETRRQKIGPAEPVRAVAITAIGLVRRGGRRTRASRASARRADARRRPRPGRGRERQPRRSG